MARAIAVLDVGKTNVKLVLFDDEGALLWERAAPNPPLPGPPYPHANVEAIWTFLNAALREANAVHPVAVIVPTTHACAGALIDDAGLLLPVMDYEFSGPDEVEAAYAALRPPYRETLSPKLPGGLNQGKQIFWQRRMFPEAFAKARYYLTYPQYWSWRMTGVAASEATMLGAHSELWRPVQRAPSSLVAALELQRLLPPMRPAWERLGRLKPDIAASTLVGGDVQVLNGLHDSNASLLPHLAARQPPFAIVSTGTWVILMAPGLAVDKLNAADDMLANVDVEGRPTATGRFMGGREYAEIVGAERGVADEGSLKRVIAAGAMALPCFAPQGGPFAARKGEIRGEVAMRDRPALATLYVALMSDLMLTRLGANEGDLIVEGSFAANKAYCGLLAALRPRQRVFAGDDAAGTARGAALLAHWPPRVQAPTHQQSVAPLIMDGLAAYGAAWQEAVR